MNALSYILIAVAIFFIFIYSLRFCIRMYFNIEFENNADTFCSLLAFLIFILILAGLLDKKFEYVVNYCAKFSFIPLFIFLHLLIWYFLTFTFSFFNFIVIFTQANTKDFFIFNTPKEIIIFLYKPIKNCKYLNLFGNTKINLDTKFNIHRLKSIIFAFYLIAGIIVVSPIYNYLLSLSDIAPFLSVLKTDYDTYQKIFIVSLIPYFLNFAFIKKKST